VIPRRDDSGPAEGGDADVNGDATDTTSGKALPVDPSNPVQKVVRRFLRQRRRRPGRLSGGSG
jgi:hypothetical protein